MTPSDTLLPQMERVQKSALFVGVVALAVSVIGLFGDAAHFWQSYLFAYHLLGRPHAGLPGHLFPA